MLLATADDAAALTSGSPPPQSKAAWLCGSMTGERAVPVCQVGVHRPTLDDVFLHYIGDRPGTNWSPDPSQ